MNEDKQTLRKRAFAARKAAHEAGAGEAARHLLRAISGLPGRVVAGYMPIRTEIDPLAAMAALHGGGMTVCVPVIKAADAPLVFHRWTPDTALIDGPFGAKVPREPVEVEPDILIVPLVAFDDAGNRLGYGGGFYDRTLERLRSQRPTPAIGFAYDAQRMNLSPEPTDQPLDAVVTERGMVVVREPAG